MSALFECVRGIDNGPRDKTAAIGEALGELGVPPARACYVGDTAKDCRCARASQCYFVGAGYGFEDASGLAAVAEEEYAGDVRYKEYAGARAPAAAAALGAGAGAGGGGGGGGEAARLARGARVAGSVGELRELLLGWYEHMRTTSQEQQAF